VERFEQLGQFAGNGDAARLAQHPGHVGDAGNHAVRRFVKHQQVGCGLEGRKFALARGRLLRQKTVKQKMRCREPGGGQRAHRRVRTRYRHHGETGFAHRRHQQRAWIRDQRRAGIADECDRFALGQQLQDFLRRAALVVFVDRRQARGDTVVRQQAPGKARVLRGDDIDATQNLERAQRDIGEISNRCGDYI
jgi:hypothetical protein